MGKGGGTLWGHAGGMCYGRRQVSCNGNQTASETIFHLKSRCAAVGCSVAIRA